MKTIQKTIMLASLAMTLSSWASGMSPAAPTVVVNNATEGVRVYPNPWRLDRDMNTSITFDRMPPNASVKIFTISGQLLKTIDAPNGSATWDRTNDSGEKAASGIYLYLVQDMLGQEFHGKFAVVQ